MRISQLLDAKGHDVLTIRPDATVTDAIELLSARRIGALVVSEDGQHELGIVSERDVVHKLAERRESLLGDRVDSIMTSVLHTCSPNDEVDSLRLTMTEHRVRHVPVLDMGRLVGIVSIGDIVKSSIDELVHDREVLVDYITAR